MRVEQQEMNVENTGQLKSEQQERIREGTKYTIFHF